jgi:hypothetical protein
MKAPIKKTTDERGLQRIKPSTPATIHGNLRKSVVLKN